MSWDGLDLKKIAAQKDRIFQTYLVLLLGLSLVFVILRVVRNIPQIAQQFCGLLPLIMFFVTLIACIFLLYAVRPFGVYAQLAVFLLFAFLLSMNLQCLTSQFEWTEVQRIWMATTLVFVALSIVGYITIALGYDLSFMGSILLGALVILIIWGIVIAITGVSQTAKRIYYLVGIAIFCVLIVYDTNLMVNRPFTTVVEDALGLLLDFVNIFTRMLALDHS
jgi:FtsH-binding integral membrane protein